MPYVDGDTLRQRLEREGRLAIDEAVRIATEVAEALQVAHECGVVHRHIKPSNILLSRGKALVADFGIAGSAGIVRSPLTRPGRDDPRHRRAGGFRRAHPQCLKPPSPVRAGLVADVLRAVLAEHELLVSSTALRELERALTEKLRMPAPIVRETVAFLRASAAIAPAAADPPRVAVRNPDDAIILDEALAAGADVLVSGDRDLLEVRGAPKIRIVDPRGFWNLARGEGG